MPPTSGQNPMRVSGMASFDRSVTTRSDAWPARPMPPPMVMPSASTTMGLRYSAMRAFTLYSARKNAAAPSGSPEPI